MIQLSHKPGLGWLVLIGGASGQWATTEPIDRAAVASMRRAGPIAFLPAAGCEPSYGTSYLAHYASLGAPDGYVVPIEDIASARDPANARLLADASLIYIGGGDTRQLLDVMRGTAALAALANAYESGAVIAAASAGAIALAARGVPLDPAVVTLEGWGWVPNTIVSPHHSRERSARLRNAQAAHPQHTGLGLPEDVALALGPHGEAERWGSGEIEVVTPQ